MGHETVLHKMKIWAEAKHNLDQVSGISSSRVKWALFLSFFSPLPICDFNPLVFFRKPQDEVGFLRAEYICYTQVISVECFLPSFPEKNRTNSSSKPSSVPPQKKWRGLNQPYPLIQHSLYVEKHDGSHIIFRKQWMGKMEWLDEIFS